MPAMTQLLQTLDRRRRDLGMSYATLALRSGVSMPTVVRILSGRHAAPALNNVGLIAEALELKLSLAPQMSSAKLRLKQAKQKAATLVGMLQGSSGLEGQALGQQSLQRLRRRTERELLNGSKRNLW